MLGLISLINVIAIIVNPIFENIIIYPYKNQNAKSTKHPKFKFAFRWDLQYWKLDKLMHLIFSNSTIN